MIRWWHRVIEAIRPLPALVGILAVLALSALITTVGVALRHPTKPAILAENYASISPETSIIPTPSGSISTMKSAPSPSSKLDSDPQTTPAVSGINTSGNADPISTPSPSPNASVSPQGVTISTNAVTLTLNRGETKSNVFSFTSNQATSFVLYGYPTTYGSGINWNPTSGSISPGQTIQVGLSVSSNVPVGTYTGTGKLLFQPGNVEKFVAFSITVQDAPHNALGFTFSADFVSITLQRGTQQNVFSFTSTGSTSYSFIGYPTSYGPGINWGISSGGSSNGSTHQQKISVVSSVSAGSYTGNGLFRDGTTGAEKSIPVHVTVTE